MDYIPIYTVILIRDRAQPTTNTAITTPADAAAIVRRYIGPADREHVVLLLLDTRYHALGLHTVSIGSLNSSMLHPREVFKAAILANAAALILAHNHPSGDATPSDEDLAITQQLHLAGQLLGIPILAHLVLGEDRFVSLKERGAI